MGEPSKAVYVLGAGFSRPLGVPLQQGLLRGIRSNEQRFRQLGLLPEFLDVVFAGTPEPALEDVFTLLDEAVERRHYCLGFAHSELAEVSSILKREILHLIHESLQRCTEQDWAPYRLWAAHLLQTRLDASQTGDPLAVLSLNWDCAVDDAVYWTIHEVGGGGCADVDYCCYTLPLRDDSPHMPSLLQKAAGRSNVKILKLHGSSNWFLCPNCDRLYTPLGSPTYDWRTYEFPQPCPSCAEVLALEPFARGGYGPLLEPFIVTPTFIKVFENPHVWMTWHNAQIELAEASDITFIGYSLPEADYRVRTLLRRAVRPDARITVVLLESDEAAEDTPSSLRHHFAAERYRAFFGPQRVGFCFGGVHAYFEEALDGLDLAGQLQGTMAKLRADPTPNQ